VVLPEAAAHLDQRALQVRQDLKDLRAYRAQPALLASLDLLDLQELRVEVELLERQGRLVRRAVLDRAVLRAVRERLEVLGLLE